MHMSKASILDQLTSSAGEGFPQEEARWAVNQLDTTAHVDWNANALETAKNYYTTMHMSKSEILDQLTSSAGERFTQEQAQYAVQNLK